MKIIWGRWQILLPLKDSQSGTKKVEISQITKNNIFSYQTLHWHTRVWTNRPFNMLFYCVLKWLHIRILVCIHFVPQAHIVKPDVLTQVWDILTTLRVSLMTAGEAWETLLCLVAAAVTFNPSIVSTAGCFTVCWLEGHCHRCDGSHQSMTLRTLGSSACEIVHSRCPSRNSGASAAKYEKKKKTSSRDKLVCNVGNLWKRLWAGLRRNVHARRILFHVDTALSCSQPALVSPLVCSCIFNPIFQLTSWRFHPCFPLVAWGMWFWSRSDPLHTAEVKSLNSNMKNMYVTVVLSFQ